VEGGISKAAGSSAPSTAAAPRASCCRLVVELDDQAHVQQARV